MLQQICLRLHFKLFLKRMHPFVDSERRQHLSLDDRLMPNNHFRLAHEKCTSTRIF